MWSFNLSSSPHHLDAHLIAPLPARPAPAPPNRIYDCPYPLEAVNMQPDYQQPSQLSHPPNGVHHNEYETVYLSGPAPPTPPPPPAEKPWQWHDSPLYGTNGSAQYYQGYQHQYVQHPAMVDSWFSYRPLPPAPPYKSYSMERLNHPSVVYSFRSPAPSPAHTPSSSPVMSRARGSSPALTMGRPVVNPPARRMIPPVPPPKSGGVVSKPPRPFRQRPTLTKAKTIDVTDGAIDGDPFQSQRPLDPASKIPSLDSLYEQLKAFAATPPPSSASSSTPSACHARPPRVDNQLAADLAAAALEMVANSPLVRSRSATFSGAHSPFAFNSRPKVFIATLMDVNWQMHPAAGAYIFFFH